MFGVSHHSKIRDFRLRVGSIAAAVFMVLWIIASTVVSAVFTVRYMGIVEDGMGEGDIPGLGRMEDSQGSMVPGRPSMVFTGRLCTDSCSRSSINYGGCDTGGRNWADLKTHVDQPGAGWNQLLSLQVKSALISAIDYGLIKTSYDYAAIESTLVPTMALLLDRINGMIS